MLLYLGASCHISSVSGDIYTHYSLLLSLHATSFNDNINIFCTSLSFYPPARKEHSHIVQIAGVVFRSCNSKQPNGSRAIQSQTKQFQGKGFGTAWIGLVARIGFTVTLLPVCNSEIGFRVAETGSSTTLPPPLPRFRNTPERNPISVHSGLLGFPVLWHAKIRSKMTKI